VTEHGTLYGIGVGPGDPDFITLKAVKVLGAVDMVFAAGSTKNDYSLALTIVQKHLAPGTEIHPLDFPMTQDQEALDLAWAANAREVLAALHQKKDVAFVTLGDPLTYSTYGYLVRTLQRLAPETSIVTVPGITAYNAAAARINLPLVEGKESLLVISGVSDMDSMRHLANCADNAVILKTYKDFDRICQVLDDLGLKKQAVLISRLGHEDERIESDLESLQGEKLPYLSLLIVKKNQSERGK
jgi:precorrin-2/cobalt-factor-2 C20-methyltransferase